MSNNISARSKEKINKNDLKKLGVIANQDRKEFFERNPKWKKLYNNRILCVALCQGAALHYVNGKNGIKDFDVWTFYKRHFKYHFPYRRIGYKDYGHSKFGVHPDLKNNYKGRKVDLIGRSISFKRNETIIEALQNYLKEKRTKSAKLLSQKAVVIIEPKEYLGKVIYAESLKSKIIIKRRDSTTCSCYAIR